MEPFIFIYICMCVCIYIFDPVQDFSHQGGCLKAMLQVYT